LLLRRRAQISFSIFDLGFAIVGLVQQLVRVLFAVLEITILSALVLATRCANYRDVFVDGDIYFSDADCYSRMTGVRICAEHPGRVVRHHDFENFPQGTTPHTTAPLDYLIFSLSILLKPLTAHAIDLAGAVVSPLLALFAGWFLWWWSRRMKLPLSLGDADSLWNQSDSRSWNGAGSAGSSILPHLARNNWRLR